MPACVDSENRLIFHCWISSLLRTLAMVPMAFAYVDPRDTTCAVQHVRFLTEEALTPGTSFKMRFMIGCPTI